MASVPYDGSGPNVAPDTRAPDDYTRLDVNADQFGAAVGRGLQQLGEGVEHAQQFQNQVRGDDAYNTYSSQATKILYGDPSKQVAGPDGTMVPDTGYFGLKGSAAVAARAGVEQQLNDLRAAGRNGLSPEAALQYDSSTRRLNTGNSERLAQHASQQEVVYQQGVHQGSADNSLNGISVNPLDADNVAHHTSDLINARVNAVRLAGGGAEQQTAAINDAKRDAVRAQVEAVAGTDPSKATEILNSKKAEAGAYYAPLLEKLHARTTAQDGQSLFKGALSGQGQPAPAPTPDAAPPAPPAANGLPQVGPVPPARGDGGPAPTAAKISDVDALAAGTRLRAGHGTDADRALQAAYLQQQNTPQSQATAPAAVPQGRDTSPAPVSHPSTHALPAKPVVDPADRSHSLPAPTPGGAALPYFTQAGAPYGISGNYLARTKQIESGSGAGQVTSPTGAKGPFQFIPSTWAHYGNGGNPMDFGASTAAAVRLAADNKATLTKSLGREPSDAELYLAHQQGAAGAAKLLNNPNARAGDLVGDRAVRVNGGDPNAPASAFASIWLNKFNGTKGATGPLPMFASGFGGQAYFGGPPPAGALPSIMPDTLQAPQPVAAAPAPPVSTLPPQAQAAQAPPPPQVAEQPTFRDPKADVYARIEASGASAEVKQHAFQAANQYFQQQQIADEQDQRAKKAHSERAYGGYTTRVLQGDLSPQILQQVAADPNLLPETKWTLTRAIREESERQGNGDKETKNYGPGFFDALKGITAQEGDPSRIVSDSAILRRAGPGGDLTFSGAEKLIAAKHGAERSVSDAAVTRSKTGLIDYAKQQLTFDQETVAPGYPGLKDAKGAALFNGTFIPRFEAAYDAHVKAGKDPWEFLTRENVDKQIAGLRSKRSMQADRMAALGEVGGAPGEAGTAPNPFTPNAPEGGGGGGAPPVAAPAAAPQPQRPVAIPPPDGYSPKGWGAVMEQPPPMPNGGQFPAAAWSQAVRMLADDPTPERIQAWNASKFGRSGYDAGAVLRQVRPDKAPPLPPAPPPEPMTLDLGQMGP